MNFSHYEEIVEIGLADTTLPALGRRAIGTAAWLELWAERLQDEMKKQNIELHPRQNLRDLTGDSNMAFTLTRRDARLLILGMHEKIAEIRRFAD